MDIAFQMPKNKSAAIKVIGVGGGGSNAVNYMAEQGINGVDFIIANTDAQALNKSGIPVKIQLGQNITEGLGAGANPEVGEKAALESLEEIKNILNTDTKMVFITAGMGGGTGTGAAPIIAKQAKDMGILTVGICTAPFSFEGRKRLEQANAGIERLRNSVDSLIVINNDKLRELFGNLSYKNAFAKADEVLATAAKGVAEVITKDYSVNIDLEDVRTVLGNSGTAIMGTGVASGSEKAKKAIEMALDSPLLNDNKITGAKNVLLLIVSGEDEVTMDEICIINDYIQNEAGHDANIIMGMGDDTELGENISVTIVATGFPKDQQALNEQNKQPIVHRLEEADIAEHKAIKINENKPIVAPTQEEKANEFTLLEEENKNHEEEFILKDKSEENDFLAPQENYEEPKDFPQNNTPKIIKDEETGITRTIFPLNDDWDNDENPSINSHGNPQNSLSAERQKQETQVEVQEKPTFTQKVDNSSNNTIDANDDKTYQQILERRERLKKFNHRFKNSLQDTEEFERVPAYKRQGIELSEYKHSKPSNYIVDEDLDQQIKLRPNNFLHDNVD
ncbi:cell division protein FtsZ [Ornithobacterium rhinotracheale]|uniref:cell division protein FtsZ n=1 Tax=Ornithobacterium rhinotracheale TaxID=28251 RepID=UPI00129C948B|nr:cell division protein FtsZ [Ornithobacterium rhinotracheale]MRJ08821.1 cell division protein FtsZ [Ornithobacterium rhinotracheale]UOH77704.1 cell division protein FtsZ [Ornithobacterium rhinotracheale]